MSWNEQENQTLANGASNSGSNPLPLLSLDEVSKDTQEMLETKSKETEFLQLPTRQDQLEFILEGHGFAEKTRFDYFESEAMSKPEPEPVKFSRKSNETNKDYQKRAKDHFDSITGPTVTEIYNQEEDHTLSVISAPLDVKNPWGFEDMTKQQDVSAPQLMFRRVGQVETERVKRSMNDLLSRALLSILWLGASGIGKSLSLVDLLVQLVRGLEHGRYVGFHRKKTFTIYSKDQDGKLKKREQMLKYDEFKDLDFKEFKKDMVILVDPPETVGDYEAFCPTLIAVSTRLKPDDLKTFLKGKVKLVAIDPCTRSEVEAMATCSSAVDNEVTYKEVMERYENVGANLRAILSRKDHEYKSFLSGLDTTVDRDLIAEEKELNPICIPSHYKYFVAPCNDPDFVSTQEDDGGCAVLQSAEYAKLRPWSDFTATKLRKLVTNARSHRLLESLQTIGISMTLGEGATVNQLELGDMAVWTPCEAAEKGLGANWTLESKGEGSGRKYRATSPGGANYRTLKGAKAAEEARAAKTDKAAKADKAAKRPKGSKRTRGQTTKPKSRQTRNKKKK